ncbi:hypothetical protein [Nocardia sp. NPDC056100]|uniref:hypothetical protein n=1 Tax=Nocardia sp. NPDC056100 TaxID=3345712 RepID=UPI0035D7385E
MASELPMHVHTLTSANLIPAAKVIPKVVCKTVGATDCKTLHQTFDTTVDTTLATVNGLNCWFAVAATGDWEDVKLQSVAASMGLASTSRTAYLMARLNADVSALDRARVMTLGSAALHALEHAVAHTHSSDTEGVNVSAFMTTHDDGERSAWTSPFASVSTTAYTSVSATGDMSAMHQDLRSPVAKGFSVVEFKVDNTSCRNALESASGSIFKSDVASSNATASATGFVVTGSTAYPREISMADADAQAMSNLPAPIQIDVVACVHALSEVGIDAFRMERQDAFNAASDSTHIKSFIRADHMDVGTVCVAAVQRSLNATSSTPSILVCGQVDEESAVTAVEAIGALGKIAGKSMDFATLKTSVRDHDHRPGKAKAQQMTRVSALPNTSHNALVKTSPTVVSSDDAQSSPQADSWTPSQIACTG